jgi:uncharacterized protein YdeI (YjbR/CyaY-like superfamily)
MRSKLDLPIISFQSARDWEKWLAKNHARVSGVWIRIFKKASGEATVTYAEALDEALCFGWIDSQGRAYDKSSYLQKFSPRKAKSGWSKINTGHAKRLSKAGRMRPAGLAAIQTAKRDGRWKRAYDSPANAKAPADFLRALESNKKAKAFFATLEKRNSYAIIYRLQTAKRPETCEARKRAIIEMLAKGKKFHP